MSLHDYHLGMQLAAKHDDDDFYGIVQALMRLADTDNLNMLKQCWPQVWEELQKRYNAPDGRLPSD